jgi:hypothetical protein
MHADARTTWIAWITVIGYAALCGMLYAGT